MGMDSLPLNCCYRGRARGGAARAGRFKQDLAIASKPLPIRSTAEGGESSTPIDKGMEFYITPKNRKELGAYAKAQGTTASRVLRMLLIEAGIISNDPIKVRRDLNGYRGKAQTFQRAIQAALKKAPKP